VPVLKIHFTEKDLARIKIAASADPMWEVVTSAYRLRRPEASRVYGEWRNESRGLIPATGKALMDVIPAYGYCPDFLTPADSGMDIHDSASALARTPEAELRRDLGEFAIQGNRIPPWLRRLADGESSALRGLGTVAQDYFRQCLAPHWSHVTRTVAKDRALRAEALLSGGLDLLLSTLHKSARWRAPVLEVDFPVDQDLHLNGRGLRLIPSFFCHGMPTTYKNPGLSPVLVYSIDHQGPLNIAGRDLGALSALLGETRSRVLETVARGDCNTSQLADRTSTSLATASQHASILRNAGLIASHKIGKSMVHVATELGLALLTPQVRH
jgi:hypothetical protein